MLVQLLAWQGMFSFSLGRLEAADCLFDRAAARLASPELAGEDLRAERALLLGFRAERISDGDIPAFRELCEQELALCRELGDTWGTRHVRCRTWG